MRLNAALGSEVNTAQYTADSPKVTAMRASHGASLYMLLVYIYVYVCIYLRFHITC